MHPQVSGQLQHSRGQLNCHEGHEQSSQGPPDYFGRPSLSMGHVQQLESTRNIQQSEASPIVFVQPGPPSLSISLEQPEHYAGMATVSGHRGVRVQLRVSEADHPPDVRSFDLEQPVEQIQQFEQSSHVPWSNSPFQSVERQEHQQEEYQAVSMVNSPVLEMVHGQALQLVPASQLFLPQQRDQHIYPLPSASHDAVVEDKQLFLDTLRNFLSALGRRLTLPKIEG
eukprot:c6197_g1_i1 orf=1-675(-)